MKIEITTALLPDVLSALHQRYGKLTATAARLNKMSQSPDYAHRRLELIEQADDYHGRALAIANLEEEIREMIK